MLGLCRLLVDGISVGERSFGLNNLRSIVTIDFKKCYALRETVTSQTKPRQKQK